VYGGTPAAERFSSLTQINKKNVRQLRLAWRFETGDRGDPETNPIIVGRTLYAYTSDLHVIALDAGTGALRWEFDPGVRGSGPSRGVAYWSDGLERRLLAGVMHLLFALDPSTGKPIESFGDHGHIDLRNGLRGEGSRFFVALTSPGMIYRDLVVVGFRTSEVKPAPPGDVRAFDVRTGALRWRFCTIPEAGTPGSETWPPNARETSGSANNWAGLTLDAARGILYVPTGSAVNDFYGADRLGNDLYANTLLALDAMTGRLLWHYQIVHHDILDRDLPTAPSLLTISRDGKALDVVAQPTKQGYLFVFDRVSGQPVFPVQEQPTPASEVPGERAAPTQPAAVLPVPFARQHLTEDLLTERSPQAHEFALQQFRMMRSAGPFTPAGIERPSVVFPGFDGGAEWGGAAVDPRSGVIYINANDLAWSAQLVRNKAPAGPGAALYESLCLSCHGPDRSGSPPAFPSLIGLSDRRTPADIAAVIHTGRGRMPPFPDVRGTNLSALLQYVLTGREADSSVNGDEREAPGIALPLSDPTAQYRFTGYKKFLDPDGYPAVVPPWGTLSAINLNTGRYVWRVPLGEYPELAAQGLSSTGTENYGGPIATAGGLVFIGATIYDRKLRAFDSDTGERLWEADLPYAGTATPATYLVDGRQYVVIATNNARNRGAPQGSAYVAFTLSQ
jgi:quinoprotein glucose dehydrogenase